MLFAFFSSVSHIFSCQNRVTLWSNVFLISNKQFLRHSWDDFYKGEERIRITQDEFSNYEFISNANYYLKNLIIQDLTANAILFVSQTDIKFLTEECTFSNITTKVATKENTGNWDDSQAGAFFFEAKSSECAINRCSADKCYNKITSSYYYLDGGNFASIRFAPNKILMTTIQLCAPSKYGVNAFRSRNTSGNYTGLNISSCNTYDTPMFTKFPGDDDSIKYSIFDGNTANSVSFGIAVVYSGKLTIDSCCFSDNSVSYLIYSSHSVNVILKNSIFIDNQIRYLAYADSGNGGSGNTYSKIYIHGCFIPSNKKIQNYKIFCIYAYR